jgi:hypothetical protein
MAGMSKYKDPEAAVPTSVDVEHPGRVYRFVAPWPWFVVEDEQVSAPAASDAVLQLVAPRRTGEWPVVAVAVSQGGGMLDDAEVGRMARSMAKSRGGKPRPPRRLRVDGARAADLATDSGQMVSHLVLVPTSQHTVAIEFECPSAVAAGYEVHLDAMLATWRWL